MFKKIFNSPWWLSTFAAIAVFLAFPTFDLWPSAILFAFFSIHLSRHFTSVRSAFFWGFWVSCVIMLGGFYWVTYVIHVFGYLPWWIASLLFAGFCGFGALNFPVTTSVGFWIEKRFDVSARSSLWWIVIYPALFTCVEWAVPKLFPWHLGHCLYQVHWLNQVAELTSSPFLTYLLISWGAALAVVVFPPVGWKRGSKRWLAFPLALSLLAIVFSLIRLSEGPAHDRTMRVGVIQPNIGSLEKVVARRGFVEKLHYINDLYIRMTDEVMSSRPNLIVWPETALVYHLDRRDLALEIENKVKQWNVPLITGAFAPGVKNPYNDYNAGFLIEPLKDGDVRYDFSPKNVLLAFGEYMPFGEAFPILYRWFPQVSKFERGDYQKIFQLEDGTRIGVSICYEMILPGFMRKMASQGVNVLVNLTNDSWFGPTSEPYLHGALSVFRAIEHRVPVVRSTNTGTSFVVDTLGNVRGMTPVYEAASLVEEIGLPSSPRETIYGRFGDWFVAVCLIALVVFIIAVKRGET